VPDFDDEWRRVVASASLAVRKGYLRVLRPTPKLDPTAAWAAAAAASEQTELLRSAIPDHDPCTPPLTYIGSSSYNLVIPSETGSDSKYLWMQQLPLRPLSGVDIEWGRVAAVRVARVMKALRRADHENAIPLAEGRENQNIFLSLGGKAFGEQPSPSALASAAVALDSVDPQALEIALEGMTWEEVARLRREVLPHAVRLRGVLEAATRASRDVSNCDVSAYRNQMQKIRDDHLGAAEALSKAWSDVGIKTLAAGMPAAGLAVLAPPNGWAAVIVAFTIGFLSRTLGSAPEAARTLFRARKKHRASPLLGLAELDRLATGAVRAAPDDGT